MVDDDKRGAFDAEVFREFEDVLEEEGVHAALRFLNERSGFRFTGVYRIDDPLLRNLQLFDRNNPELELGADTPLKETYCSIVGREVEPLSIDDARTDPRTTEHPSKDITQSYFGVPLRLEDGTAFGTLCHFDLVPRHGEPEEWPLMEAAAQAIMKRFVEV